MAEINFDAGSYEPATSYEPLPAGKYNAQITASELRPTKNGLGQYLWLQFEVLDGDFAGRNFFDRLNIENQNQTTVDIARRTLSALCRACGKMAVADSEELHWVPLVANLSVREGNGDFGPSNDVKGYFPAGSGNGSTAAPAPRPQPARPAQAMKPWEAAKMARQGT